MFETNKYQKFEQIKKQIASTAKSPDEYERRVKALEERMGV